MKQKPSHQDQNAISNVFFFPFTFLSSTEKQERTFLHDSHSSLKCLLHCDHDQALRFTW